MIAESMKIPCSVGILTFNSGAGLRRCLESVADFAEIIICDGGSTDETLEIAREFACRIISQDKLFQSENGKITNFAGVRNQTLAAASYDWFFIIDSDEYLALKTPAVIAKLIKEDTPAAPKLLHALRKFVVEGQVIECAGTYPSYQPRLFHKDYVENFARILHEKIVPKAGTVEGRLQAPTLVPLDITKSVIKNKHEYYLAMELGRCKGHTDKQLWWSVWFNLRAALVRLIKLVRSKFVCTGARMPLSFELQSVGYSVRLAGGLFVMLIKRFL